MDAAAAFDAVIGRGDHDLPRLYEVYLLGVQAMQTIEPVVGLWAYTRIIEAGSRTGRRNLDHAQDLADELRQEGYVVPPNPRRNPNTIRAAAVHPMPKDPEYPSEDEILWLRQLAYAYLLRRTTTGKRH
jgi:hypothetical protein